MSPENDPTLIEQINTHGVAAGMAFVLSWLRIQYDNKEPRPVRRLIEASLGGVLVFLIGITAERFGVSQGWSYVAAGFIGVLGVDQVREFAHKWARKKVGD